MSQDKYENNEFTVQNKRNEITLPDSILYTFNSSGKMNDSQLTLTF
jgi:hypothetical protein